MQKFTPAHLPCPHPFHYTPIGLFQTDAQVTRVTDPFGKIQFLSSAEIGHTTFRLFIPVDQPSAAEGSPYCFPESHALTDQT
ncbi:MAG: hypothetical protein ACKO9F_00920, partial [Caldilinea sp.]